MKNNEIKYEYLFSNGLWEIIKIDGDCAYYSHCPCCGYIHSCYKTIRNKVTREWEGLDYDSENEFNFCPMCGTNMEVR